MYTPSPVQTYTRYFLYLLWEFRWPLAVFWGLVAGGGLLLQQTYHHHELELAEACYAVFLMIFLEPYLDFPDEWYLQPMFFVVPIIGLAAVADSLVRLGYLIFARKNRLPEWQRMVASLYRQHTVVVGAGTIGYQIIRELVALREPVVIIQRTEPEDSELVEDLLDREIPMIRGDARNVKILEQAGVRKARAVVLATSDDLTNLDAALTARDLNPEARIVLRLFDESLAEKVRGAFALPAISTSHVAAPAFVAAATGRRIYQDFQLGGRHLHLIDLTICPDSGLAGWTIGRVQSDLRVNIVMHHGPDRVDVNPGHDLTLNPGDEILVIAPIEKLRNLEALNTPTAGAPIVVTHPEPERPAGA